MFFWGGASCWNLSHLINPAEEESEFPQELMLCVRDGYHIAEEVAEEVRRQGRSRAKARSELQKQGLVRRG